MCKSIKSTSFGSLCTPVQIVFFILFVFCSCIFLFFSMIKQSHQKSKVMFLECAPRPCEEPRDVLACLKLLDGTLSQECATKDTYLL